MVNLLHKIPVIVTVGPLRPTWFEDRRYKDADFDKCVIIQKVLLALDREYVSVAPQREQPQQNADPQIYAGRLEPKNAPSRCIFVTKS